LPCYRGLPSLTFVRGKGDIDLRDGEGRKIITIIMLSRAFLSPHCASELRGGRRNKEVVQEER
jgi:hypothetical protein